VRLDSTEVFESTGVNILSRKAPLTEEEESLQGIKQAEAEASIGTSSRSSHTSSGVNFPFTNEALQALKELEGEGDNLVQLVRHPLRGAPFGGLPYPF